MIDPFWSKYITSDLENYRGFIFLDNEDSWKIWRKINLWFRKWHEQFGKFSSEHLKGSKLVLSCDHFVQSRKYMNWKFTEELCAMPMNNDKKPEEELTRRFITDIRNLTNFDSSTQKSENLHFNGFFWPKYITLELRKYREIMFDTTQGWYKICRKTDLCFYKWHVEFGKCSPKYLRISNWDFHDMLLSKAENVWAWIWQGIYVLWLRKMTTAWKMSKYGVISGLYFPVFRLNTEIYFVNLSIQSEYRKIRTRNNYVFGHFSCSGCKN